MFGSGTARAGNGLVAAVGVTSLGCAVALVALAVTSVPRLQGGQPRLGVSADGSPAAHEVSAVRPQEQARLAAMPPRLGRAASTAPGRVAAEASTECQLVVGDAVFRALASLSGGVPSVVQVAGTPLVAAFANLPPALSDPLLLAYSQFVDAVTVAATATGDTVLAVNAATNSVAPVVNPVVKPVGVATIDAVTTLLGQGDKALRAAGLQVSFFEWLSATLVQYKTTFGFTDSDPSTCPGS